MRIKLVIAMLPLVAAFALVALVRRLAAAPLRKSHAA